MSKKRTNYLIYFIALGSLIAAIVGIGSSLFDAENTLQTQAEQAQIPFLSVHGQDIALYNRGIYHLDSVSLAAQGIASDWVTALIAVPALLVLTRGYNKENLRAHLALIGVLGYFAYTYMSYTFLWMYNPLFLLYVALMSTSLFCLGSTLTQLDHQNLLKHVNQKASVKWVALVQILVGVMIGLLWLGLILKGLLEGTAPQALEHYTTLVIQGMDLGFVVPLALTSGYLLWRRHTWGYILSALMLTKGLSMLLAINAMILAMSLAGVPVTLVQTLLFATFLLLFLASTLYYYFVFLIRHPKPLPVPFCN